MREELISFETAKLAKEKGFNEKCQYYRLKVIQKTYPKLTFNNKGYEYIRKSTFSKEDLKAFKEVSNILKDHIIGFIKFNNFLDSRDVIRLRFQYNWGAEDNSLSFIGVGYIELDELFEGFKEQINGRK